MNDDIKKDLFYQKYKKYINDYVDELIKNNPLLLKEYPILEIEYNLDGTSKDIYSLASERDIKKVQINSDKNELDYKFSQKQIDKLKYENEINKINDKINNYDLLYDELIFNILNNKTIEEIKKSILEYNLNNIDLDRLAHAIISVCDNKIEEFRCNNKMFMKDKITYWNYKYNEISRDISKSRELESFILDLIKK